MTTDHYYEALAMREEVYKRLDDYGGGVNEYGQTLEEWAESVADEMIALGAYSPTDDYIDHAQEWLDDVTPQQLAGKLKKTLPFRA